MASLSPRPRRAPHACTPHARQLTAGRREDCSASSRVRSRDAHDGGGSGGGGWDMIQCPFTHGEPNHAELLVAKGLKDRTIQYLEHVTLCHTPRPAPPLPHLHLPTFPPLSLSFTPALRPPAPPQPPTLVTPQVNPRARSRPEGPQRAPTPETRPPFARKELPHRADGSSRRAYGGPRGGSTSPTPTRPAAPALAPGDHDPRLGVINGRARQRGDAPRR